MAKYSYPAIFHKENELYWVEFPDLPCDTSGDSFDDALAMAEDALTLLLKTYEEERIEIPSPSDVSALSKEGNIVRMINCSTSYKL